MSGERVPVRRCPECGDEFLPHIVRCSDCGADLEDGFEGEDPSGGPPDGVESPPPTVQYNWILHGLAPATADLAAQHLSAAGIPFGLEMHPRQGLRLGVTEGDVPTAVAVLERAGIAPEQPDPSQRAVAEEGGPCPACGEHIAAGTSECPGCGLRVAGGFPCTHCGAELTPISGECPDCGKEQD